jgi:hypothetical protein
MVSNGAQLGPVHQHPPIPTSVHPLILSPSHPFFTHYQPTQAHPPAPLGHGEHSTQPYSMATGSAIHPLPPPHSHSIISSPPQPTATGFFPAPHHTPLRHIPAPHNQQHVWNGPEAQSPPTGRQSGTATHALYANPIASHISPPHLSTASNYTTTQTQAAPQSEIPRPSRYMGEREREINFISRLASINSAMRRDIWERPSKVRNTTKTREN